MSEVHIIKEMDDSSDLIRRRDPERREAHGPGTHVLSIQCLRSS